MATIVEAAVLVLKAESKPLSIDEIYSAICRDNLFEFKAQEPKAILKAQLRKNTLGFSGKSAAEKPKLRQLENKKYQLI